jgi:hypothetical protein
MGEKGRAKKVHILHLPSLPIIGRAFHQAAARIFSGSNESLLAHHLNVQQWPQKKLLETRWTGGLSTYKTKQYRL